MPPRPSQFARIASFTSMTVPPPVGEKVQPLNEVNITICFLAMVLNIAEMVLIIRKRRINVFERVLFSLCIADILVVLLYIIQSFYELHYQRPLYGFGLEHLLRQPLEIFSVMSSVTNIIVLGIDRLIAVKYPLKHGIWVTTKRINIWIAVAWVASIALSVISNANRYAAPKDKSDAARNGATYIFSALLFISGLLITVIYSIIVHTVLRRGSKVKGITRVVAEKNTRSEEIAVTITCVLVVVAFSICSYPFAIDILISKKNPMLPFKTILLNAALDPLVYFFKGYVKKRLNARQETVVQLSTMNETVNFNTSKNGPK